jgi:hypothetical protein
VPLASIPFKSPAAFDLPSAISEPIRGARQDEAAQAALELLAQLDAGDAMAIAFVDARGGMRLEAVYGATPDAEQALREWSWDVEAALSSQDAFGKAVLDAHPLLFMGDLHRDDTGPLAPSFKAYVLGHASQAALGFLYAYPLPGPEDKAVGALIIHRTLAAGPLNHDQPAIVQAIALLLGEAATL